MLKVYAIVVLTATTALALPANDNPSLSARNLSCYADGEIWGDQLEEALKFAEMACTELRGTYDHDEVAATCFPMSDQKHVEFLIRRTEAPQSDMPVWPQSLSALEKTSG